jgi:NAD(P)-dependent dehydrogenase (short-subunit alcohol dehydrogenase family)
VQAADLAAISLRRREKLEETAKSITDNGGEAVCIELDVTNADSVQNCFSEAEKAVGHVDILVNNAGIAGESSLLESKEKVWDAIVDTNLKGVFLVAQAAAKSMVESEKAGSIINIASIAGLFGAKGLAIYGAAKSGVVGLTKSMALEWVRYGIRVNALAPGYIVTDLNRAWFESDAAEYLIRNIPMRRTGNLEELTVPLLLLASDAGGFMTGSIVVVDGGQTAGPV